ncbi:hypothetical protein F4679DRAFT_562281 [Xylaria curta]|nr:hypothetical protein F4679DRAFT_562281 [Xylaria curta]
MYIALEIAFEALAKFTSAVSRFISDRRDICCIDISKEAIEKHDIAKYKIDLLLRIDEEIIRAQVWSWINGSAARLRTQQISILWTLYKKALNVVKKAVDATTNLKDDQSEKIDKTRVGILLQGLHTIWTHARDHFRYPFDVKLTMSIRRRV